MGTDNLKKMINRIAEIGADPSGGCSRIFGSDSLAECRKFLPAYFRDCGMHTCTDAAGNVHGIYAEDAPGKEIIVGSHYDTVRQGGNFDGVLGFTAACEAVRSIRESGIPCRYPIHVIATNGEEGNELGGTFGSRAMVGILPLADPVWMKKAETYGYTAEGLRSARLNANSAGYYLELHIEQGPTLWQSGEQIGIVTGIVGLRRYHITVHGVSNHAGTTMMELREDALVGAAHLVLLADQIARDMGHHMVATVGTLQVSPGSVAVIPGQVDMVLEIRNEDEHLLDQYWQSFREKAGSYGWDIDTTSLVEKKPIKCSNELEQVIEDACTKNHLKYRFMPSGATHDGNAMSLVAPVGMIFVPSIEGISHSPHENTDWQDVENGYQILLQTLISLEGK